MSSALGGWSTSLCPHPHMSLVTPTLFSSRGRIGPVSVLVPNCFPRNVVVRDLSAAPRFPTPLPGTPRRCRFFSPLWGSPLRLSSLLALPLCPPPPPYPHARRPIDGHSSSQYLNAVGRPPAPPARPSGPVATSIPGPRGPARRARRGSRLKNGGVEAPCAFAGRGRDPPCPAGVSAPHPPRPAPFFFPMRQALPHRAAGVTAAAKAAPAAPSPSTARCQIGSRRT